MWGKERELTIRRRAGTSKTVRLWTKDGCLRCGADLLVNLFFSTVWLYDHDEPLWDPNGILTWLRNELHDTEKAGQRAWISKSALSGSTNLFTRSQLRSKRHAN